MKDYPLLSIELRSESDVVLARQRARQIASLLGLDAQDQTRVATAVSEIARNAQQYAGRGLVQFRLETGAALALAIGVTDEGDGIPDVQAVLEGRYQSATGSGVGLVGSQKLMDRFSVVSSEGAGTHVELAKLLPRDIGAPAEVIRQVTEELARQSTESPLGEIRRQNQELLGALDALKQKQAELGLLNRELAETNRGVMTLYAELEEKAEALKKAGDVKERFFSEMNHEIRTPINAILSLSELLLNGTVTSPLPEQRKPLGFIRKAAEQLSQLVDDLLDLAKFESGKMVVRPDVFTTEELFGSLRGVFRPLHLRPEVALVFEDASGTGRLHTDEGKVSQILRNLISNALKFTEQGEVRISANRGEPETIVFTVADTGIGIPAEEQAKLFDPYYQVENPRQRRTKGTGLGLSLSQNLARLLGGRISLTSEPGVGSTFQLTLPRVYVAPSPIARERAPFAARTVLIVDDDEIARYLLREAIGEEYAILEAESGVEGLGKAQQDRPDLVFLDLMMPGMDGFTVLEMMKSDPRTRDIPVVIHTSKELTSADARRLAPWATAILAKRGVSRTEEIERVQAVLRRVAHAQAMGATRQANDGQTTNTSR